MKKLEGQHKMKKTKEGMVNKNEKTGKVEKRNENPEEGNNHQEDTIAGPGPNMDQ